MKFLIELDAQGLPTSDDGLYILKYKDIISWNYDLVIETKSDFLFNHYHDEFCPVGTVEFVHQWFQHFFKKIPLIPNHKNFKNHFTRKIIFSSDNPRLSDIEELGSSVFIKGELYAKQIPTKIVSSEVAHQIILSNAKIQIQEVVEFSDEFRFFIFEGKVVDCRRYLGEWFGKTPTVNDINNNLGDQLGIKNGTIDFGFSIGSGRWELIEAHNFYSCGHYGFNSRVIPLMVYRSWNELKRIS